MGISRPTEPVGWFFIALDILFVIVLILLLIYKAELSFGKFTDVGLRNIHLPKSLRWFHAEYSYKKQWFFTYAFSAFAFIITAFVSTHLLHGDSKWYHQYPLYFWCSLLTFTTHQIKRCIEVLYIHQYSHSKMHFGSGLILISAYFMMGLTMSYGNITNNLPASELNDSAFIYVGIIIWFLGEMGNLYCHIYLAYARKKLGDTGYIPLRHLPVIFRIFICPNMLFELVIWSGYNIIMRELNSFIILVAMIIYVGTRLYQTKKWYESHPEGTVKADCFDAEPPVIGTSDLSMVSMDTTIVSSDTSIEEVTNCDTNELNNNVTQHEENNKNKNKIPTDTAEAEIKKLYSEHNEVLSYSKRIGICWIIISVTQKLLFSCRWYVWILYAIELGQHNTAMLAFAAYSVYFIQSFSNFCWGWIADKYTYDAIAIILSFFIFIGLLMESLASNYTVLFIGTIMVDIFRAHQTLATAFLTKYLPTDTAVKYISFRFAGSAVSTLLGPVVGGVMTDLINIRSPFYFSCIISFSSFLILFFVVKGTQKKIHSEQTKLKKLYDLVENSNNSINIEEERKFPISTKQYILEQQKEEINSQNNHNNNIYTKFKQQIPSLSADQWFRLTNILLANAAILSVEGGIATYWVVFVFNLHNMSTTAATIMVSIAAVGFMIASVITPKMISKYKSRFNLQSGNFNLEFGSSITGNIFMILFCILYSKHSCWLWIYSAISGLAMGTLNVLTEIILLSVQPKQHAGKIVGAKQFIRSMGRAFITLIIGTLWIADIYWFLYAQSIFYGISLICTATLMIHLKLVGAN